MDKGRGYKPIADYAAIGNLSTVALVGLDGSIDWCCFPYLDSPSVFAALLDNRRGGRFRIAPVGAGYGKQHYIEATNILQTRFQVGNGLLTITDFMPIGGNIHGRGQIESVPEIQRLLRCEGDSVEVEVEWSPRLEYALPRTRIEPVRGGWLATVDEVRLVLVGLPEGELASDTFGPAVTARLRIEPGEERALVCRWGTAEPSRVLKHSHDALMHTQGIWHEWSSREAAFGNYGWAGPWKPMVMRSALALKLLTNAGTGAIAAAPTTSLPETIGGVRNWDYRYSWLRDGAMSAQALASVGHHAEANALLDWMEAVSETQHEKGWELQILYGMHGESSIAEQELEHLEGYGGSRPVRIGNAAAQQRQNGVFGELLNTGFVLHERTGILPDHLARFLGQTADHVLDIWHLPDQGIWEMRTEPMHHTYSKLMCWVAIDRAIHLSKHYSLPGKVNRWYEAWQTMRQKILTHGYNDQLGSFVQSFDSDVLDAANLRIPLIEFLPADDPRVQGTIDRVLEQLTVDGLVYRYLTDDGLPDREGAFGLCTFWLVDALALSGRIDEARSIFDGMLSRANHVGLYPEQIDPSTGAFLGNFPQAFTHIGFINSALYLAHAEGRLDSGNLPLGSHEHHEHVKREEPTGENKPG